MFILALDLGNKTGWASSHGDSVCSGTWDLAKFGPSVGQKLVGFECHLQAMSLECSTMIFETPWVGPKTHQHTARLLMSLAGVTEMVAGRHNAHCYEIGAPTWRKHFLGIGRTTGVGSKQKHRGDMKRLAMERCRMLGFDPKSEDEAEAIGILDYALATLRAERTISGAGPLFGGGRAA
jgi:hypothetical protein